MNKPIFQLLAPGDTIEWQGNVGVVRSAFFNEKRTRKEIFDWAFITHKIQTQSTLQSLFEIIKTH